MNSRESRASPLPESAAGRRPCSPVLRIPARARDSRLTFPRDRTNRRETSTYPCACKFFKPPDPRALFLKSNGGGTSSRSRACMVHIMAGEPVDLHRARWCCTALGEGIGGQPRRKFRDIRFGVERAVLVVGQGKGEPGMRTTLLAIAILFAVSAPMDAEHRKYRRRGYSVYGHVEAGPGYGRSLHFSTKPHRYRRHHPGHHRDRYVCRRCRPGYRGRGPIYRDYRPGYRYYSPSYRPVPKYRYKHHKRRHYDKKYYRKHNRQYGYPYCR